MSKIAKIKNWHVEILFLIFLCLIFILWGRILYGELIKKNYPENIYTKKDRISALSYYGWEVLDESEQIENITIPENFDKVYEEYNKLQKLSGFNLEKYKGKNVTKFTYIAKNFPTKTDSVVYINILVKDGQLIGGDCMTPALSGFMLPLDRRFLP